MTRETRLKSLAGFGPNTVSSFFNTVWVVTMDNLVECKVTSFPEKGYCYVLIGDKKKKYRKTRVYVSKQMAQLRFIRDTDKYFKPMGFRFKPSINKERIVRIRNEISIDEPVWFI